MDMETNSERRRRKLAALCEERGLKNIAYRADVSAASLDQIIKRVLLPPKKDGSRSPRNLGDDAARRIEDAEGLGRGWFDDSDQTPSVTNIPQVGDASSVQSNVLLVGLNKLVPRLAWSEVLGFVNGMFQAPDDRYEVVSARNVTERCFLLEVSGDAMAGPIHDESFPHGSLLVCDPDQAPQPGQLVIALHPKTQEPVFRRLVVDGGVWFLKASNPAYPLVEIDGPSAIVARVFKVTIERDV